MAEFYRATKIEQLNRKHAGLQEFVEARFAEKVTHTQIASLLEEIYGEAVSVQAISNHYVLRWWKKQNEELTAWRRAHQDYLILKLEQEQDPAGDAAKVISTLAESAIIQQRQRLAESDPVRLMAELRKSRELAANIEIEKGKLQVAVQNAENERKLLELKVQQLEAQQEKAREALEEASNRLGKGESLRVEDITRIRERVFGESGDREIG